MVAKHTIINPRRHRPFRILPRHRGGGGYDPRAVSPLIELELRGKNELQPAARRRDWCMNLGLVLGQPVTSEVRSSAEKSRKPVIAYKFASVTKVCFPKRKYENTIRKNGSSGLKWFVNFF